MYTLCVPSGKSGHIRIRSWDGRESLELPKNTLFKLRKPHAHFTCVWTRLCHA